MKRRLSIFLSLILTLAFVVSIVGPGFTEEGEKAKPTEKMAGEEPVEEDQVTTVKGNVVCLLPSYEAKEGASVKPVIADKPCTEWPPHAHALVTEKQEVYLLTGTEEKVRELEETSQRRDVEITGKVGGPERNRTINIFGVKVPVK